MMRLAFVSGSQRLGSQHSRLLRGCRNYLQSVSRDYEVDVVGAPDVDLPLFNQDLERDPEILSKVMRLHRRLELAHGFVIATPEYNGQVTPYLKNLVDWVTRLGWIDGTSASPFIDRPLLLCSVSPGWSGGALGIVQARALFGYVGACVVGDAFSAARIHESWPVSQGNESDIGSMSPGYRQHLTEALGRLMKLASDRAQGLGVAACAAHDPATTFAT